MRNPRPAATYAKENSCIEDVLAIANEIAQANQPSTALDSRTSKTSRPRTERRTGFHGNWNHR